MCTESELAAQADDAIDLARSNPRSAASAARRLLSDAVAAGDVLARIRSLRALGLASRDLRLTADAKGHLSEAHALALSFDHLSEAALAATTLASVLFIAGDSEAAVGTLEEALEYDEATRAVVNLQLANVLFRSAHHRQAIDRFGEALPSFEASGDLERAARILNNRGRAYLLSGDADAGERDLRRCRELFVELGLDFQVPYVDFNLAQVHLYRSELVDALRLLATSEEEIRRLGGDVVEVQSVYCEALLSAGLFKETLDRARIAAKEMAKLELESDRAELLLVGAQAALFLADHSTAITMADEAEGLLRGQKRKGWYLVARYLSLKARGTVDASSQEILRDVLDVASRLDELGQSVPSADLRLVALRMAIEQRRLEAARSVLDGMKVDAGPLELRLRTWLGRAMLANAERRDRDVLASGRSGFRLLDRHRSLIGASDIRAGVSAHGAELGQLALSTAVRRRNPRLCLEWMEETRTAALRRPPVDPATSPELAADLAHLRGLSSQIREATSPDLPSLLRELARTQQRVNRRSRSASAEGPESTAPARAPQISSALGDRLLVELAIVDDNLWAVVVDDGRANLYDLGGAGPLLVSARGARAALDRAAQQGAARARLINEARELGETLDRTILQALPLQPGPLVLSPPVVLDAVPWALLPSLADRPFSIVPSAGLWLAASNPVTGSGAALISGPGLAFASAETRAIQRIHGSGAMRLNAQQSQSQPALTAMNGAVLAHLSCHGRFNPEQPMFSTLALTDGDLTLHDLSQLAIPPSIMVLAACEAGLSQQGAGDELIGTVGTLLSMGTRAVVAATGAIPDSTATVRLMVILHEALRDGATVAEALLEVRRAAKSPVAKVAAYSLLCFGYGEATLTG